MRTFLFLFMSMFFPLVVYALPPGFEMHAVATGLNLPTSIAFSPDGRIFIAEKSGTVRVVKDGLLFPDPFLQLVDVNDYADRGLIGIALDPDFAANGWVYLSYTYENDPSHYEGPKTGRIVRVRAFGDAADMDTLEVLVGTVGGTPEAPSCEDYKVTADCIPSDEPSHSVGGLRFGLDGKLYATLGDGASFEFPDPLAERAQNLDSLAGKMLRLNPEGTAPADNPFYAGDPNTNRSKVWSYGLRNAFRFSFHPGTGIPYLGDVGWFTAEEINEGVGGRNFGWPCREGYGPTPGYECAVSGYTDPWHVYGHDPGTGAGSVTAGVFYEGSAYPAEYVGDYIFGDFAMDFLKRIRIDASGAVVAVEDFMAKPGGPVDIVLGPDENMYYLAIYAGELRQITHTAGNRKPIAQASAYPTSGLTPLSVQFSSNESFDPDGDALTYLWDFGDGSTSQDPSPSYTYTQRGTYTVVLTVDDGRGATAVDTISIVAGNEAPRATILSPPDGSTYYPGETVILRGEGVDPEDGMLRDEDLAWTIILHHNTHIHVLQQLVGSEASFLGPDHQAADVHIEVELRITDSVGLQDTTSIRLYLESAVPRGVFRSEFYNTKDLSGQAVLTRTDPSVDFNWGLNAPDPAVLADQFSARFTGDFDFVAGDYTFTVAADDGIRLFVGGSLVLDQWIDQSATVYAVTVPLQDGTHRVQLEYYDNFYNAVAELRWERTETFSEAPEPKPRHETTTVVPQNPVIGETITVTSTARNAGAEKPILVDIEVYRGDAKVAQEFYDNVTIPSESFRDFELVWTPSEPGEYRVAVGLIEVGWGDLYEWTNDGAFFTVSDEPAPDIQTLWIYEDALASGWTSWSWDANVTFESSIGVAFTQEWGGLYLHHDGLDTMGMSFLQFDISGGTSGEQELQVLAFDAQTELLAPKRLFDYIPNIPAGETVSASIPLVDLGIQPGERITGFGLQGISGIVEPLFFVDNIRLSF